MGYVTQLQFFPNNVQNVHFNLIVYFYSQKEGWFVSLFVCFFKCYFINLLLKIVGTVNNVNTQSKEMGCCSQHKGHIS